MDTSRARIKPKFEGLAVALSKSKKLSVLRFILSPQRKEWDYPIRSTIWHRFCSKFKSASKSTHICHRHRYKLKKWTE